MKRNECDGQSVYSAQIVDDYVVEVLHKCFERIKATPKDAAIEKKFRTQLSQIRQEIKKLEKESETLKRKLGELTEEIANALIGDSKFTPDVLSMAIENTKAKITENAKKISEKQSKLRNTEVELKNIDVYYEEFVSWADEFDTASLERKKMIICRLFKEITVGKGYKIEILMDSSYEQFLT